MRRRLGVLGLGAMGLPVAARLAGSGGFAVSGFDVSDERCALAAAAGVSPAGSARALAAAVDVLLVALPGAAAERAALLPDEEAGTLAGLRPGSLLIELTSGDPALSRELARHAAQRGAGFVSAPMAGDPAAVAAGALGLFVAGAPAHRQSARGVLSALARTDRIRVVGDDPGAAQTAKLLVNAAWFAQAAVIGEVLVTAERAGLAPTAMAELLATGAAGSRFVDDYVPRLLRGDDVDTFGIDGVVEELDTVVAAASAQGTPVELLAHVRDLHAAARERFGPVAGELLVIRLLEERAGSRLRADAATGADQR